MSPKTKKFESEGTTRCVCERSNWSGPEKTTAEILAWRVEKSKQNAEAYLQRMEAYLQRMKGVK